MLPTSDCVRYAEKKTASGWLSNGQMSKRAHAASAPATGPFQMSVSQPWFSAIKKGAKTIEGRLAKPKFLALEVGDTAVISRSGPVSASRSRAPTSSTSAASKVVAVVTRVVRYKSFAEYLSQEGLARTLPGVRTIDEGVQTYRQFYTAADEAEHGVAAIHIALVQ